MEEKRKRMRKLWVVAILAMVLLSIPASASAKTVAKIGNKKYSSLEQAVSKVKKGQTIKLQANIVLSRTSQVVLNRNTTYTIDFNKKKIKGSLGIRIKKGKVTFKNGNVEGILRVDKGASLSIKGGSYQNLVNYGTTSITSGNFANNKVNASDVVENYGKLTIKKATIKSYKAFCLENQKKGSMTIKGGTFSNAKGKGSNILQNLGKASVSGGTFTSNEKGIPLNNLGTITITGGKFINPTASSNTYDPSTPAGYISNSGTMTVKGGTITAKKSATAILSTGTLSIRGGRIESYASKPKPFRKDMWPAVVNAQSGKLTISGGTIYSRNGRGVEASPAVAYLKTGGKIRAVTETGEE